MDERTHFYSVVASALQFTTPANQAKITAIFERKEEQLAENIIKEIGTIIGTDTLYDILMSLSEVENNVTIAQYTKPG